MARFTDSEIDALVAGIDDVADLISSSTGVAGLHMNGDVAEWDELLEGGRFEAWLMRLSTAMDIIRARRAFGCDGGPCNA